MKNIRQKWLEKKEAWFDRVPSKKQVALNLLLICVFLLLAYIFLGCPAFSLEQKYRRAEKANLVGPAEILGTEAIEYQSGDTLVIAETEDAVILYVAPKGWAQDFHLNMLTYRQKMGDVSVYGAPMWHTHNRTLTMLVVDEYPQAVRAELDMELFWQDSETGEVYRFRYRLAADRQTSGYFRMDLEYADDGILDYTDPELQAIIRFGILSRSQSGYSNLDYPATVRLYDESGTLICQRQLQLFPEAGA